MSQVLLIDVGNTNLKWCVHENDELSDPVSLKHSTDLLSQLQTQWADLNPRAVHIASVSHSDITVQLDKLCQSLWQLKVHTLEVEKQAFGVTNGYQIAHTLGIDRWLALIAARQLVQTDACIVDAGSALTIDMLDASGQHQGGLILPGLEMMKRSLLSDTSIPQQHDAHDYQYAQLATTTACAINNGCLSALVAPINQLLSEHQDTDIQLLLTGGDAAIILPFVERSADLIADLVFQGMSKFIKRE